ncbi:thermonuclease family protein [Thermaerobacter marianensis]|uniref:thermonuclease family protein n=1 Tax=Thermaerobacter marianensis TaxID=73919 RepID=UPI001FA6E15B|nr:thermonuclease family protein [Thermaerobacter marianensis]
MVRTIRPKVGLRKGGLIKNGSLRKSGLTASGLTAATALVVALVVAVALGVAGCAAERQQSTTADPGAPGTERPAMEGGGAGGGNEANAGTWGSSGTAPETHPGTDPAGGPGRRSGPVQPAAGRERPGVTRARVVHVVDGDTIDVEPLAGAPLPATRVRLIGVNTPEIHGDVEPYGPEAARFTQRRLTGKTVWLEKDVSETDRYGRALRYVWLVAPPAEPTEAEIRKGMFNAILVLEGYAQVATYPPDVRYAELFVRFQREARQAERGLWGAGAAGGGAARAPSGGSRSPGAGAGAMGRAGAAGSTAPGGRTGCDPSYPDVCIPSPPPDLDCGDIPYRNFRVLPPDPHRFDGRDRDGIGCES